MAMNASYLNLTAQAGGTAITHLGLVDAGGTEITGGTYARIATTWTTASAGLIRPNADKAFNIPSGVTVGGWRGYTALTGGTDHGGATLTSQAFSSAGTYTLLAASTAIDHDAV